jgi:hypothetical protein
MGGKNAKQKLQAWSEARQRHHLTDAQVRMARELGMNPARLGKSDEREYERSKRPLPQFIEDTYRKRFGKTSPDVSRTAEKAEREEQAKRKSPAPPRDSRESPRGSTIPPFPRQRIDD